MQNHSIPLYGPLHWWVLTLSAMMCGTEITAKQSCPIEFFRPVQGVNVLISNRSVVNAILYIAEHGCKWCGLPERFGNWHRIHLRMNRRVRAGVLDRLFEEMPHQQLIRIKIEAVSLGSSASVKVYPDGTGELETQGHKPSASPLADGRPKIPVVAVDASAAAAFLGSPEQAHVALPRRALLRTLESLPQGCRVIIDRADESDKTRSPSFGLGFEPVAPRFRDASNHGHTAKPGTGSGTRLRACSAGGRLSTHLQPMRGRYQFYDVLRPHARRRDAAIGLTDPNRSIFRNGPP